MAKKDEQKAKSNGSGKSRMRVFVAGFDMEGSDDVMAEGFKAIRELSASISRSTILPPALAGKPALGAPKPETGTGSTTLESDEVEQPVEVEVEDVEVDDAQEETPTNGNGSGVKRSYNFKTPTFKNDLDVMKAKKPLNDFMAEKAPPDVMAKYLAVVYWLQKHMDISEVTIDHVYTVFDILGWKSDMPSNPSIPLRDLKSKKHMLTREPGAEGYKLNFKGEQEVEKMGATK